MSPDKRPITLRLSRELDERLADEAKKIGISKNAYLLTLIDKGMKTA